MGNGKWKELMGIGEGLRERGHILEAIKTLEKALEAASPGVKMAEVLGQLGLCYEHDDDFSEAEKLYTQGLKLLEYPMNNREVAEKGRLMRHISSVKLKRGDTIQAYKLAVEARSRAASLDFVPTDMAWFTHGVIKCMKALKTPKENIRFWVECEGAEISDMWPREENQIRKYVWLTGYFADVAYAWGPWSWGYYGLAFFISWLRGLKLRLRQVGPKKR